MNLYQRGETMADVTPKRYTLEQLGRLQEVSTTIDCECPNHLAILLTNLTTFEDYSARCQSRGATDAEVHAMLYRETQRARVIMEAALAQLLAHENVALE